MAGVPIPAGRSVVLGNVNISPYYKIRVYAAERAGSVTPIAIRLAVIEGRQPFMLDVLKLKAETECTEVYGVPGRRLRITATAARGLGMNKVDVLVYGHR